MGYAAGDSPGVSGEKPAVGAKWTAENKLRAELIVLRNQLCVHYLVRDPDFKRKPLHQLNSEALAFYKEGDDMHCVAAFAKVFRKSRENNVIHRELYVAHCNRAAAYLNLGLYEEALWDARRCAELAERQFMRQQERSALPSYIKSFARRGFALMGMGLHRAAKTAFEEGLRYDPFADDLKRGLENATQALLGDLLSGKSRQTLALPAPTKRERIASLPYAAPLHTVHPRDLLPVALLTPFQAENDHHIKDTYNYCTVQADCYIPKRSLALFQDDARLDAFESAIKHAIEALHADDKDARVLHLGSGAGLLPLMALQHGARHVTVAERWLYMALNAKEVLVSNGVDAAAASVVYKRPTDLALRTDVPVACNLVVCDILEDGLLSAGIIPACRHALAKLALPDAIVLPASATVYVQAVELRVTKVCDLDVSAINLHRWEPSHSSGAPLAPEALTPLSEPRPVWHFDFVAPPDDSDTKLVDITFTRAGRFNAVIFWFDLHLGGGITLSTGPESRVSTLRPAVQYLPGELIVEDNMVLPLRCSHNTVQMRFDLEREEYVHLYKQDASFPRHHFAALRNEPRAAAFQAAIQRQIAKRVATGEAVHALDIGAGSGLLAMMVARAGASSVVAAELHPSLAHVARRNIAANGFSHVITVVQRDAALLERGRDVRHQGCNFAVVDLVDAGLLGDRVVNLIGAARANVLQPGATVVPAAATLYCMGIQAQTTRVRGFDMRPMNKYRWEPTYEAVHLARLPHVQLTKPRRVFEVFFDGSAKNSAQEGVLKLEVIADGLLNAIVFWFDLHLDEEATITSAPPGFGNGGEPTHNHQAADAIQHLSLFSGSSHTSRPGSHHEQALQYLERAVDVTTAKKATVLFKVEDERVSFSLRDSEGDWVDKPPWRITWGGGASVESPHFQRVHYCELLVKEFLMRVRCGRFPPIEKDMRMVLAHCGSLFLDPEALADVFRDLVVLEALHVQPDFSRYATVNAIAKKPLTLG